MGKLASTQSFLSRLSKNETSTRFNEPIRVEEAKGKGVSTRDLAQPFRLLAAQNEMS